jgi:hypothetical protein
MTGSNTSRRHLEEKEKGNAILKTLAQYFYALLFSGQG